MTIDLVLAEDHPLVLDGLRRLCESAGDIRVLASCHDGEAAVAAVVEHAPDVLVLDLSLPKRPGIAVVKEIGQLCPETKVVIFTAGIDEDELLEAVRLGVRGVVLKEMAPAQLVECIRRVHGGERWLEQKLAGRALDRIVARQAQASRISEVLSRREIEIVRLVAQGLRNKEIARQLGISEGTVKIHIHNVYEKLNVKGRVALASYAREHGILL